MQAIGLLHDVVEDTETTLEDVETRCGAFIRAGVEAMTRREDPDTGEWAETHKDYIRRCCADPIWRVIKRYDVYDNYNPRRHHPKSPIGRYAWTLEYIEGLK
jgi:(p)ppGpp synthase/HD superfamily hydrolase